VSAALVLGFLAGPVLTGWVHEAVMAWQAPRRSSFHAVVVPIGMTSLLALLAMIGVAWGGRERMPLEASSEISGGRKPRPQAMRMLLALSGFAALGLGVFEVGLSLQNQQLWRWSLRDLGGLFAICSLVMLGIQLGLFVRLRRALHPEVLIIRGGAIAHTRGGLLTVPAAANHVDIQAESLPGLQGSRREDRT
jgi:DHA1 family multidrug resistance protein-like MFS transporter